MFSFFATSCPCLRSSWWSCAIRRPNALTDAAVPLLAASVPSALSAALASSRSAAMLASVNAGAGAGVVAAVFPVVSIAMAAAVSVLFEALEHAANTTHTLSNEAPRARRIDIRPLRTGSTARTFRMAGPALASSVREQRRAGEAVLASPHRLADFSRRVRGPARGHVRVYARRSARTALHATRRESRRSSE